MHDTVKNFIKFFYDKVLHSLGAPITHCRCAHGLGPRHHQAAPGQGRQGRQAAGRQAADAAGGGCGGRRMRPAGGTCERGVHCTVLSECRPNSEDPPPSPPDCVSLLYVSLVAIPAKG